MAPSTSPRRCAAPLRAVVSASEVAALLDCNPRAMLKQIRAGKIPEARPSFDQLGYDFDWRDVQRMIEDRYPQGSSRDVAMRNLLGLRAGTRRAELGEFHDVVQHDWDDTPIRVCPADSLLDTELNAVIDAARTGLGETVTDPQAFDRWADEHADGLSHLDVMLRLGFGSWELAAAAPEEESAPVAELDFRDPLVALREAALYFGHSPSHAGFDRWAKKTGCPLRAAGIRARYGGVWNAAIREAGLVASTNVGVQSAASHIPSSAVSTACRNPGFHHDQETLIHADSLPALQHQPFRHGGI